jgi:ABC-type lipopolysaccharide export system ATPase subunit
MSATIVAEHLTKTFGAGRGITDVNLTVEPGRVFGFLGPNAPVSRPRSGACSACTGRRAG